MKTGEIIIEKADSAKKCLHSIKRVHRLIEEELMMEYDMKTTNNIITNTTDNDSSSNRGNKLSRYHEKNEFCTPYSIDQSKKDASTTSTTTERSILTTKKCSSTTSLLYDLLSGRENFDSVYMRSQLVFVTCDNSKSLTSNLKKDDILTRRRVTNSHIQRRRKSLKPTKHYNSSQPTETSVSTGENLFHNNQLSEKLSSSSPLSSSSSSISSSPSSSSSSSMLSPLNMNILTRPQISPKKLIDKLECLKTSCILHSESPVKHCSFVHTTTSISGTTTTSTNINNQEQPLDLSSASSYFNQSGLLSNIPYKSLTSKRRRSFAGDLNYSSRLSDYSNIIRCNSSRHNSVTLPLSPTDSNFIKCFSSPSTTTTTTTISSTNVNTNNNCNLKSECKSSEEYPCKLNVNNQLNDESTFIGANLLDLFLSPAYYQVALSTALALCASSIFHSFDNTLNRTINNLPNSYNHLKTAYELAYEQLLTLTNYSKDTTTNLSSENDQSNLSELNQTTSLNETINHQSNIIQHKQQSVSIQSNFNVKYNTLTTLKTGDNIQHSKKSLTKLCFMTKNTENNNNNNNRITKLLNSKNKFIIIQSNIESTFQ
ncbi:hypothetical protein EWB00_002076 [Schistosoma japonicum]|nr:hypothetical protein EWB00_002076 [Schistosoma japonicum]